MLTEPIERRAEGIAPEEQDRWARKWRETRETFDLPDALREYIGASLVPIIKK